MRYVLMVGLLLVLVGCGAVVTAPPLACETVAVVADGATASTATIAVCR